MRRSRAPSIAPGTFFIVQYWADCITNIAGFNLRQAPALYSAGVPLGSYGNGPLTSSTEEMRPSCRLPKNHTCGAKPGQSAKAIMTVIHRSFSTGDTDKAWSFQILMFIPPPSSVKAWHSIFALGISMLAGSVLSFSAER